MAGAVNERTPLQSYEGGATFVRQCSRCNRFVKPDETIQTHEWHGLKKQPNATCSKCGRTTMLFIGFIGGKECSP